MVTGKVTCTRRLHFCAGHRVLRHEGKCANLHGHNYVVFITAQADSLDEVGRVVDFSVLKERIGTWIDLNWDHKFLLYSKDEDAIAAVKRVNADDATVLLPFNPTAENIALHLLREVGPLLMQGTGVCLSSVVVHETENCSAEVSL